MGLDMTCDAEVIVPSQCEVDGRASVTAKKHTFCRMSDMELGKAAMHRAKASSPLQCQADRFGSVNLAASICAQKHCSLSFPLT